MLTQLRKVPVKYPSGTELVSRQLGQIIKANSFGLLEDKNQTPANINIGGRFEVPEFLNKVILRENFGYRLYIDHYFLCKDPEVTLRSELIPIYIRVVEEDGVSSSLLFRKGIEKIRGGKYTFLNKHIAQLVTINLLSYASLTERDDLEDFLTEIDCSLDLLAPEENRLFIDDLHLAQGYPWYNAQPEILSAIPNIPYESQFIDLTYDDDTRRQFDGRFNRWREGTKIDLLRSIYCLTTAESNPYQPDLLTQKCMTKGGITLSEAIHSASIAKHKFEPMSIINYDSSYQLLTQYSSSVLSLCSLMHQLPMDELELTYILPLRGGLDKGDVVIFTHWYACGYVDLKQVKELIKQRLNYLTKSWDQKIHEIKLFKTVNDELYLCIINEEHKQFKYFIDLTLTAVLSQELIEE